MAPAGAAAAAEPVQVNQKQVEAVGQVEERHTKRKAAMEERLEESLQQAQKRQQKNDEGLAFLNGRSALGKAAAGLLKPFQGRFSLQH